MNYRFVMSVAALTLLAGCKNSDCWSGTCSDTSAQGGDPGPQDGGLLTITEDNALPALREAWFAATTTADIPVFVVTTGVGDVSGGTTKAGDSAASQSGKGAGDTVYVDPFGPTTYNCPVSGTFIVSGDVADPEIVTAGDFINYDASACDSGTGYTVDGNFSLDIISIVGDVSSGEYEQAQVLTFSDFRATTPTLVTTLNGDHTAVIDTQPSDRVTTSFSGNSLVINEDQITITIRSFAGFASQRTDSPLTYTLSAAGNADSSAVSGSFDYVTEEEIFQEGSANPFDGIVDIYGNGNGTARIAVLDDTRVVIQVDANGSGNYESSTELTWGEFLGG